MKRLFQYLPALLLLASCHRELSGCGSPAPDGYRVFVHVGTSMLLQSWENVSHNTLGYTLPTTIQRTGNRLHLRYCETIAPTEVAAMSLGPARSALYLPKLPPRAYQLDITVRQRHTTGTLDLTTTPIRLTIADTTVAAVR